MSRLRLTLACRDYDRVKPLMTGVVEPVGIDLNILPLSSDESVWPMVRYQEFELSEMTLASYTRLRAAGAAPYVGIPVFLARTFTHGGIFVRPDAPIESPKDLEGRRVASGQFLMTFAVWARGLLAGEFDVDLSRIEWFTGRPEDPLDLPGPLGYSLLPPGAMLPERLAAGEIDALIHPRVPRGTGADGGPRRLLPDHHRREVEYFRRTGVHPILHLVVIRRDVYDAHPWVASSLYRAFKEARDACYADLAETLEGVKYTVPWLDDHLDEVRQVMGEDFWPYGVAANRHVLTTFIEYMSQQHLIDRLLEPEELFAENALG